MDMFNHRNGALTEFTTSRKSTVLIQTNSDIPKGASVTISYGSFANTTLLHSYGFCLRENMADTVRLTLAGMDPVHLRLPLPWEATAAAVEHALASDEDVAEAVPP